MTSEPIFEDADAFYESLLDAHQGLSREQSESLNARLVLVLANQVGSTQALLACLKVAQQTGDETL